jgi:hypothetical protein
MSYLLGLGDARGSSAELAYAQLMAGSLGQPPAMLQAAKTFPPPVPLPAMPLPPEDEPADDVPPNDIEPANDDVPPSDVEPADDVPPNDVEPADDDVPPNVEPADDEPDVETEVEPADVEPEEEPPDELESTPELPLVVPQATTTGVTASAKAQAIDEIRMSGFLGIRSAVAPGAVQVGNSLSVDLNAKRLLASRTEPMAGQQWNHCSEWRQR